MKSWFLSLTQRERVMVQVASSVVTVFLLYLLVLDPISSNYSKNKKNVQAATETLEWMKNAASESASFGVLYPSLYSNRGRN